MIFIMFIGGKLTGWGRNYYDRIQRQDITIHEDPVIIDGARTLR